jgi:hypothetical protein
LGAVWYYFANRNYHGYDSRFILLDEDFNGNTLVYFSGDPMLSDYWHVLLVILGVMVRSCSLMTLAVMPSLLHFTDSYVS